MRYSAGKRLHETAKIGRKEIEQTIIGRRQVLAMKVDRYKN